MSDDKEIQLLYRHPKRGIELRRLRPACIWHGSTDWHSEPQWMLSALALDRPGEPIRDFPLTDLIGAPGGVAGDLVGQMRKELNRLWDAGEVTNEIEQMRAELNRLAPPKEEGNEFAEPKEHKA